MSVPNTAPDAGRREIDGKTYLVGYGGSLVPEEMVKPQTKLEDELVRKVFGFAVDLSAQIARFKQHAFDDVDSFVALLEQEYGAGTKGSKGNMSFGTHDGLIRIQVQVQESIEFGPELQVAKGIVDECLRDWSSGSPAELRAIVDRAFNVDQQGKINRSALFGLLRLNIEDERWQRGMQAIRDSIRPVGSKRYVRIHYRASVEAPWQMISLDVASA